jgi:hypothetical protein
LPILLNVDITNIENILKEGEIKEKIIIIDGKLITEKYIGNNLSFIIGIYFNNKRYFLF